MPRIVRSGEPPPSLLSPQVAALLGIGRAEGRMVTDHRTSWVRELPADGRSYYVKVYEYETWGSRLRDLGRRTAPWTRSRAAAEFDALRWLRAREVPAPEPVLVGEHRTFGFLARAVLVTAAFAGEPVDAWLDQLDPTARRELALAVGRLVGRLHRLGFRDRNLDLRNLLARRDAAGNWVVAKLDSPRHRLRAPGRADRLVQADWERLLPQLARYGVDTIARAAATAP